MPRVVSIDFTGLTPAQGGGSSDYIPQGRYPLRVTKVEQTTAQASGNPMFVVSFEVGAGPERGKRLTDRFVKVPDKPFGMQRFMMFLQVISGQNIPSQTLNIDLDNLVGKVCQADVRDNLMPAQGNYQERITSQIDSYYPMTAPTAATNGAAPAAAIPPTPTASVATPAVSAVGEPVAASVGGAAVVPEPIAAAPPAPVEAAVAVAASEVDDLFS